MWGTAVLAWPFKWSRDYMHSHCFATYRRCGVNAANNNIEKKKMKRIYLNEALANDPKVSIICVYVEDDGRKTVTKLQDYRRKIAPSKNNCCQVTGRNQKANKLTKKEAAAAAEQRSSVQKVQRAKIKQAIDMYHTFVAHRPVLRSNADIAFI